ncbi:MAG: FAD-dependent oxidoreductase [Bacteroidota bacterium]
MKNVIIIGNGISGISAARHIRKLSDHNITVISAETDHFFSRTALMYIYMGHMKYENTKPYEDNFWVKNRIALVRDYVEKINVNDKSLTLKSGKTMDYDDLVLAVGSKPNKFGWPGQDLKGVSGLYSYQDLEAVEEYTKDIKRGVIVGGGLIGIELAEMLLSRNIPVTFLVREKSFWNNVLPKQESEMINRHIREHHVDLRLGHELKEILSDENGRARGIITNDDEEIACGFVGLTAGVSPNIAFLKESEVELGRGILVNEFLETSAPGVYAVGDCAERRNPIVNRRPLEQVWYTGRMMGEVVAHTICGSRTEYKPGIWFNSAKFFDIEYQTYGHIWSELRENEEEFYWEHSSGKMCVHFVYDRESRRLLGVNTFGIRLRHEVFDRWLGEQRDMNFVMENLREANFDPEFFDRHEEAIVSAYNEQNPGNEVVLKKKAGLLAKLFG